jgi:hypothetical protein
MRIFCQTVLIVLSLALNAGSSESENWRSSLYPENWTPGFKDAENRFLHDFSYAGYHHGEKKLPLAKDSKIYNVIKDFGADNTGKSDASAAFQKAIDNAGKHGGGIVFIPAGLYRLGKAITIKKNGVILRGEGVEKSRLFFPSNQNLAGKSSIAFQGKVKYGKEIPLVKAGKQLTDSIYLKSVKNLSPGMDIAVGCVITDEFRKRHGMEAYWKFAANKWRPFFQRRIVAVDSENNSIKLDVPLRYDLQLLDKASVRIVNGYLSECGLEDLSVADFVSKSESWKLNRVHLISMTGCRDCWISRINSFDPVGKGSGFHLQSGGIVIRRSKNITASNCEMSNAANRGPGGNGYLFEITQSNEVLVRDCTGANGRHNFIINWDFSTNGCVFLRVKSSGSRAYKAFWDPMGFPCGSDFHHSLAMANLVDSPEVNDGWDALNRGNWSSEAGHSGTENVFWNISGKGYVHSAQFAWGYVIGTAPEISIVTTDSLFSSGGGTEPVDFVEGAGKASSLVPQSLYESQLSKRLNQKSK